MRRKLHGEGHENSDRWLLTYSDMITLLMAFFIMMYSMSVLNVSKFHEAAISIRSGFGGIIRGQGKSVLRATGTFATKPSPIAGDSAGAAWHVIRPLVSFIEKDAAMRKSAEVTQDDRGVVVSMLSDNLLFAPGSAEIRTPAFPLLDKIAETLDKLGNDVRIEGHTCDLPPRPGSGYETNWELSTARATNVLRYFVEQKGLNARLFSAAGYAGTHPLVPNTTDRNRRKNRRVDMVIVAGERLAKQQPAPQDSAANGEIRRRSN
jgi:chemotaxis protein MotB